jgi:hypothetical protein
MTTARPDHVSGPQARRRGLMEQLTGALGNILGGGIGWLAETGILFAIFLLIWIAFGVGIVASQGSVDQAWQVVRDLPLIGQIIVWVLFLPVMIGLWVWENDWPLFVRAVLVIGLAGWNLLMFLPKALQGRS